MVRITFDPIETFDWIQNFTLQIFKKFQPDMSVKFLHLLKYYSSYSPGQIELVKPNISSLIQP